MSFGRVSSTGRTVLRASLPAWLRAWAAAPKAESEFRFESRVGELAETSEAVDLMMPSYFCASRSSV